MLPTSTVSKLRRLMEAREQRDADKKAAENSEKEYRALESEVWDELDESPLAGTLKLDLGEPFGTITFVPRETYYGRVIDEDAFLEYLEQRALSDEYTKPGLQKARINELVRGCVESGQDLPPGLDFYAQRPVSISRPKG